MCSQASHDIVQAITIDVIDAHFGAANASACARPASQRDRVVRPWSFRSSFGRLFPPAMRGDNVHASITVDVANTKPMLRRNAVALLRNTMHDPWRSRVGGIGASPADGVTSYKRCVRLSIAVDVFENRYFGPNHRQNVVLVPTAQLAPRINVERHRSAGRDQSIRPAVACEIIGIVNHRRG